MANRPTGIRTWTDVPASSGLAGSSVLILAVLAALRAFYALDARRWNDYALAEIAQRAEEHDLGIVCGYADRYAPLFGDLAYVAYHGKLWHAPLGEEPYATYEKLGAFIPPLAFVVATTGVQRDSGSVHAPMRARYLEERRQRRRRAAGPGAADGRDGVARQDRPARPRSARARRADRSQPGVGGRDDGDSAVSRAAPATRSARSSPPRAPPVPSARSSPAPAAAAPSSPCPPPDAAERLADALRTFAVQEDLASEVLRRAGRARRAADRAMRRAFTAETRRRGESDHELTSPCLRVSAVKMSSRDHSRRRRWVAARRARRAPFEGDGAGRRTGR